MKLQITEQIKESARFLLDFKQYLHSVAIKSQGFVLLIGDFFFYLLFFF